MTDTESSSADTGDQRDPMPSHTPGPWTVKDYNADDVKSCVRFNGPAVVYAEDDCDIHPIADCTCNHTCKWDEEVAANASLIAAAPDMLAALKAVVRTRDRLAFDQARAAIAKAEGRNA